MLLVWMRCKFQTLKTVLVLRKCRAAAVVRREEGGPKIFVGRRMKLFAWDGWLLARIPSMGLINRVPHFGEEFTLTMRKKMKAGTKGGKRSDGIKKVQT